MDTYEHVMNDFKLRPLQVRQHLIEVHHIEPKQARKGYEREVWHNQHDNEHYDGISGFRTARDGNNINVVL